MTIQLRKRLHLHKEGNQYLNPLAKIKVPSLQKVLLKMFLLKEVLEEDHLNLEKDHLNLEKDHNLINNKVLLQEYLLLNKIHRVQKVHLLLK